MTRRIAAFVRHADYQQRIDTPSALQPFALKKESIRQVQQAAAEMFDFIQLRGWDLVADVDTSSLLRAWQTAEIFSEQLKPLFIYPARLYGFDELAERSVGSVANLSIQEIEAVIDNDPRFDKLPENWKSDSYFKLPFIGAESLLEAGQRVANHLSRQMSQLAVESNTQIKLFFGHGAAFRHAAYKLGIIDFEQIPMLSMYHAMPIYLEYLPDGSWQHIAGEWKIRSKSEYVD